MGKTGTMGSLWYEIMVSFHLYVLLSSTSTFSLFNVYTLGWELSTLQALRREDMRAIRGC